MLSKKAYVRLNHTVMTVIFFIPLTLIAFFESQIAHSRTGMISQYFQQYDPDEEGDPKVEDPDCDDDEGIICTKSFKELSKDFPK